MGLPLFACGTYFTGIAASEYIGLSENETALSASIIILLPLFIIQWILVRAYGRAKERGSLAAWIGWQLAVLPIALLLFYTASDAISQLFYGPDLLPTWPEYWLRNAFEQAIFIFLALPFLIIAAGYAITMRPPPAMEILRHGKDIVFRAALLAAAITLVLHIIADMLIENFGYTPASQTVAISTAVVSAVFLTVNFLTDVAISVTAYRQIEARIIAGRDRL